MASHPSTTRQPLRLYVSHNDSRTELLLSQSKLQIEAGILSEWADNQILLEAEGDIDPELIISDERVEYEKSRTRVEGNETRTSTTWRWNPKGKIGYQTLRIVDLKSKTELFDGQCYISPSKIDRATYDEMLKEIQRICYSLIYDYYKDAFEFVKEQDIQGVEDAQEQFRKLERTLSQLTGILSRIARNPHKALAKVSRPEFIFASRRPDERELRRLVAHPNKLSSRENGNPNLSSLVKCLPFEIPNIEIVDTYDVPENRLIRHFVNDMLGEEIGLIAIAAAREIERIKENTFHYQNYQGEIDDLQDVISRCNGFRQQISHIQRIYPFLREAGTLKTTSIRSLVLQRERNYREFYKLYLDFLKKRARPLYSDAFFMTIKEIQELYEMYCLLKIIELSGQLEFKTIGQNVFQADELKFTYRLSSGSSPVITMRKGDARLLIFYKKEYNQQSLKTRGFGSRGETHVPDISLELYVSRQSLIPRILIFDAKYREYDASIIDKLAAYKHDIGRPDESTVWYAEALWMDHRSDYLAKRNPGNTGGCYFAPDCDFSVVKDMLIDFASLS